MAKKNLLTYLLAALLAPLFFACAHATNESGDGYGDAASVDGNPALRDPGIELAPGSETLSTEAVKAEKAEEQKVAEAQKAVVQDPKTFKKIEHPFAAPPTLVAAAKVHKKVRAKAKHFTAVPFPDAVKKSPVPGAPDTLVTRNGSLLNRYYFFRVGDTAEGLSKLFYGNADRAAEIVDWNGPKERWTPGAVFYYRSNKNEQDEKMLSYYSESGAKADSITVGKGDTFRTLAQKHLGSPQSWREIAVLNGLRPQSVPKVGTELKVYPLSIGKDSFVAKTELVDPKPFVADNKDPKEASAELGGFIHHNPLLVACSAVALFLLLGFFFLQRRRYRSRFDF